METIRKWTSPTQELTVEGINLTSADVYVTFRQDGNTLTFSGEDLTMAYTEPDTTITVHLTQEQTGAFNSKLILVQVNWVQDGQRNATNIVSFKPMENLYKQVIE